MLRRRPSQELLDLRAQRDIYERAHREARALVAAVRTRAAAGPGIAPGRAGASIDLHGAQNPDYADRGIARQVAEHVRALQAVADRPLVPVVSPHLPLTPQLEALGPLHRAPAEPVPPPALHHVPSPLEWGFPLDGVWPVWAREPGVPLVVTLHDLIPLVLPDDYLGLPWEWVAFRARLALVTAADHVLAISQQTADDARRLLGAEDVTVIDAGVSMAFPPRRPAPFVFSVGGADPRKNLERLVRGWAAAGEASRAGRRLVITCTLPPDREAALQAVAREAGVAIELTGHVDDRRLAELYATCELFVFPSLYEGSGLPVLEAMAAGAPVVTARTSTGPELVGSEDGTFDPYDERAIGAAIADALTTPGRLEALTRRSAERAPRFTWERTARLALEGYDRALQAVAGRGHRPLPATMA